MNQSSLQSSTLERALALVVRYWACNMTIVRDLGQHWPGFGYDESEQDTLRAIAREVDAAEFTVWLSLVVLFFMAFSALIVIGGGLWVSHAAPNPAASAPTSAVFDYAPMCAQLVVCLSVGFPLALLVASLGCDRLFTTVARTLPDCATTLHFIDKLVFQIARIAVLGAIVDFALLVFVPADSTVWLRLKLVMPLLAPTLSAMTLAYYASARLRRTATGTER